MFDYESIKNLTENDVLILNGLLPLAEEAKKAEEDIKAAYLFRIGEESIEIWGDEYNREYLTHQGVWQARYLHQTYDVKCTAEEIFKHLKAEYLIKNGYVKESINGRLTEEGELAMVLRYFSCFMKKAAEKAKTAK